MAALTFPGSPTNGQVFNTFVFNSTRGVWERNPYAVISGGTETSYTDANGQDWSAHIFSTSGTLTVSKAGQLDVLCIGGGAGSSSRYGHHSGGGAGAVRWGWFDFDTVGDYTIVIGGTTSITKPNSSEFLLASGAGRGGNAHNDPQSFSLDGWGGGGSTGGVSRNGGGTYGGGSGGLVYGAHNQDGIELDYETGSPIEYAQGGHENISATDNNAKPAGSGGGNLGSADQNHSGRPGLVVVRYKV
jgi:hypothetical protein